MSSSSYKVNDSPIPERSGIVKIEDPKTDDKMESTTTTIIEEAEEVEVAAETPKQKGHSKTNGTSVSNGHASGKAAAASSNGILKNKSTKKNEDWSSEDKWKNNYVPCSSKESDKQVNGDIIKHVSDIFEEVFREPRGNWSLKIEHIASCLGISIALSNFWRFPILIHKYGGGAFLFCYVVLLCLVGLPLYLMEEGIGQFSQLGCIHVWRCAPLMQGVGVAMLVLSLVTSIYNSQLVAYVVHYFFSSFVNLEGMVLWGECRSSWQNCHDASSNLICSSVNFTSFDPNECWQNSMTSSKYYWENSILRISELHEPGRTGPIHWDLTLCLIFVWFFTFLFLMKGMKSSGKVALFTGVVPFCILLAFLVASLNKPGASKGLLEFYKPDWEMLLKPEVWQRAMEQVILSLGVTYGGIIMISSYNKFGNKRIQLDAFSLTFVNLLISVMAATTLFAFCGVFAEMFGIRDPRTFMETEVSGTELLFVFYPEVISRVLPVPHVWAIFFFMMLLCLGLHSQFTLIEVVLTTVYDTLPRMRRKKTVVTLSLVVPLFLLSLPLCSSTGHHIMEQLRTSVIGPNVTLIAIFEFVALFYFYGIRKFCRDLKIIIGSQPSIIWKVQWMFISPVILIVLFVFAAIDWERLLYEDRDRYVDWSIYLSWSLALLPLAMIPITFVYAFIYKLCVKEPLFEPSPKWGPGCVEVKYVTHSHGSTSTSEESLTPNREEDAAQD